jgi:hypothetical protein
MNNIYTLEAEVIDLAHSKQDGTSDASAVLAITMFYIFGHNCL